MILFHCIPNEPGAPPRSLWRARGPVNLGSGGELSLYAVARGGCIGNVGQGDMGPIIP